MRQSPAPVATLNENSTATPEAPESRLGKEFENDFVKEMKRRLGR